MRKQCDYSLHLPDACQYSPVISRQVRQVRYGFGAGKHSLHATATRARQQLESSGDRGHPYDAGDRSYDVHALIRSSGHTARRMLSGHAILRPRASMLIAQWEA